MFASGSPAESHLSFDRFRVDPESRQLTRDGAGVALSPKAFDVLVLLLAHRGQVLEKAELMRRLWPDTFVDEANLNVHISSIRKALGESAQHPHYIETVPGRGYRFRATTQSEPRPAMMRTRWRWLAAGAALFPLLVAGVSGFRDTAPPRSLAVLPFRELGKSSAPLGEGMADSLITRMSGLKFHVRPTSAILRYAGQETDSIRAGRDLQVDAVVEGSIQRRADRVRITVRMIRVGDGQALWGARYDEPFTDLFTIQDAIATKVAEALRAQLSASERSTLLARHTNDVEAYELYVIGRHFWNKRTRQGMERALESFQKAIDEDPNYARAYAGLADVYAILGDLSGTPSAYHAQAEAAARKALALDDRIAEAHVSLAYLRMRTWNWAEVEPEFERAFALDPNYATGHQWYSIYLELMGRPEDAIREAELASRHDPLSPIIRESLASRLYFARRYDRALASLRKSVATDPSFQAARETLWFVQIEMGMYDDAVLDLTHVAMPDARPTSATLAYALAKAGRAREARAMLSRLGDTDPVEIARIHAALGEYEAALTILERALRDHQDHLVFIKVDPSWDAMRANPRFVALLRAMRLS